MSDQSKPDVLAAHALFKREGLPDPPIPLRLASSVHFRSSWHFGTRPDTPRLYDFQWRIDELLLKAVGDYVEFGQDGHGVSSYGVYYYLAYGPLALALQLPWGGAFTDPHDAIKHIATVFTATENLIALAEPHPALVERRLLVTVSSHHGAGLEWLSAGAGRGVSEEPRASREADVLDRAHVLLRSL